MAASTATTRHCSTPLGAPRRRRCIPGMRCAIPGFVVKRLRREEHRDHVRLGCGVNGGLIVFRKLPIPLVRGLSLERLMDFGSRRLDLFQCVFGCQICER